MTNVRDQVILPLRSHPQPHPHLAKGGDCAACCIAGLCGIRPEQVYERLHDGKIESPSRPETLTVLRKAEEMGLIQRYVIDVPTWPTPHYYMAFGASGYLNHPEWFRYMRMAFEAGYYGLASVVFDKSGCEGKLPPATDHMVVLCGTRINVIPHPTLPSSHLKEEILVSCSAKSSPNEEWVGTKEFLAERGGYNVILVKP